MQRGLSTWGLLTWRSRRAPCRPSVGTPLGSTRVDAYALNDGLHHLLRRDPLVERATDVAAQLALLALRHQRRDGQQAPRLQVDVRALSAPSVAEAELDQLALDVLGLLGRQGREA